MIKDGKWIVGRNMNAAKLCDHVWRFCVVRAPQYTRASLFLFRLGFASFTEAKMCHRILLRVLSIVAVSKASTVMPGN